MKWTVIALAAAGLLAGCGMESRPAGQAPPANSRTYDAPKAEVWADLVAYAGDVFFGIDALDAESGIMAISWAAPGRTDYLDCGTYPSLFGEVPLLDHWPLEDLSGRMNITVRPEGDHRTVVRVNVRYVALLRSTYGDLAHVAFESATSSRSSDRYGMIVANCRASGVLERQVLDAIAGQSATK